MKVPLLLLVAATLAKLPVPAFAFSSLFNPINDITDRILVIAERDPFGNFWVIGDSFDATDHQLQLMLASSVAELTDPAPTCDNHMWFSEPFTASDAAVWNDSLSSEGSIPWGAAGGTGAGGVTASWLCRSPTWVGAVCSFVIPAGGLLSGWAIDSFLQRRSDVAPTMYAGCRVGVAEHRCEISGGGLFQTAPMVVVSSVSWARACD